LHFSQLLAIFVGSSSIKIIMENIIINAIKTDSTIRLKYDGNDRHVMPLVFGTCRNGKESLLCYKIDLNERQETVLSVRLYYMEKVTDVCSDGAVVSFPRKISYYLSRFFKPHPVAQIAV